jgi:hypothetical protein
MGENCTTYSIEVLDGVEGYISIEFKDERKAVLARKLLELISTFSDMSEVGEIVGWTPPPTYSAIHAEKVSQLTPRVIQQHVAMPQLSHRELAQYFGLLEGDISHIIGPRCPIGD